MALKTLPESYVTLLSLTTAYISFGRLPREKQPTREMDTIRKMIRSYKSDGMTSLMFAEIVLKLNPDAEVQLVYGLFGIEMQAMKEAS